MRLTIHRGTHEIGGNCVELAVGDTRLILDLGTPLVTRAGDPFDSGELRRQTREQLLTDGVLPRVDGLYDSGPHSPTAILLSHAHGDHSGLLHFAAVEIPVYLSQGTSKMLLAGSIFAGQERLPRERCITLEPDQPTQIGEFRVTGFRVDHSAFDSFAFLIEGGGKRVFYSGDLRMHGRKPWMAERLLNAIRASTIDVLLMEGTQFSPGRVAGITEQQLEQQIVDHLAKAGQLALACFSPMHVDRLVTFYRAARRTGRIFVVDPYAAFVMHLVSGQCNIPKPESGAGIRVYYNRYFVESWERRRLKKIYDQFLADRIEFDEIDANRSQYLMVFRPSMIDRDFQGRLPTGSCCFYSYWAGYLDKPDWVKLRQVVNECEGSFIIAHTSGHIFRDDIVEFVNAIQPRQVVPIHTVEPGQFAEVFTQARLLEDGEVMQLN